MAERSIKLEGSLVTGASSEKLRLIKLKGHLARQLSHYGAHQNDLSYCQELLNSLAGRPLDLITDAIWKTAIITYIKCFSGSKPRSTQLHDDVIYKGNADALDAFKYFKDLRNKHLAHDENDYTTCVPCASINFGGKGYKVENVGFIGTTALTLDQSNFTNLFNLVAEAKQWVHERHMKLTKAINDELEAMPLEELLAHEEAHLSMPDLDRIDLPRESGT